MSTVPDFSTDARAANWFGNDAPLLQRCWHPVLPSVELADKPVRVTVGDRAWVLARLGTGTNGSGVAAYRDLCPHRRVPLSAGRVEGSELVCGYHGWRFDASGRCTAIPALGQGAAVPRGMGAQAAGGICEAGGLIWLAPQAPVTPAPALPTVPGAGLVWGACPPRTTRVSIGVLMDNFLDVAHFSYLHRHSIGVAEPVVVDDFDVSYEGFILRATHEATVSQDKGGERRIARYRLHGPTVLELGLEFPETGHRSFILFWMHASSASETTVYKLVGWPADDAAQLPEQVEGEIRILEEDLSIVELMEDPRMPLTLREEQHTRADRVGVEFRKMLSAGLTAVE
jgi:vanillate O-demethylase monooxygenase subunit